MLCLKKSMIDQFIDQTVQSSSKQKTIDKVRAKRVNVESTNTARNSPKKVKIQRGDVIEGN